MHFATKYIGQPYKAGFFDFLGLVRKVDADEYGVNLPAFPVDVDNLRQLIKIVKEKSNSNLWQEEKVPKEGAVVLLRQSRHPVHVGIWLNVDGGGVLHNERTTGVVFQNLHSLRLNGWQIAGYYKFTGAKT